MTTGTSAGFWQYPYACRSALLADLHSAAMMVLWETLKTACQGTECGDSKRCIYRWQSTCATLRRELMTSTGRGWKSWTQTISRCVDAFGEILGFSNHRTC